MDASVALTVTAMAWILVGSYMAWQFFIRKLVRKPASVNTRTASTAGVIGAMLAATGYAVSEGLFLALLGFAFLVIFGAGTVIALMAHFCDLLRRQRT
jgi:hypothetical protein